MKSRYQKLAAIILLAITASPLLFGMFLHVSQVVNQFEMREKLEKENLVTITVDQSQLQWTDKGEEAVINGDMFDVESYSINGNKIKLTGLFDKSEDALIAQIETAQKNNPDNANNNSLVFQLFGYFSFHITENNFACNVAESSKQAFAPFQNPGITSAELLKETPPPKSILS